MSQRIFQFRRIVLTKLYSQISKRNFYNSKTRFQYYHSKFNHSRTLNSTLKYGIIWSSITSGLLFWNFNSQTNSIMKDVYCQSKREQTLRMNTSIEIDFFRAIRSNDINAIMHMIKMKSIDVNMRHVLGWTPLHLAAIRGHADIVKILLEEGADPDAIDEFSNARQIAHEHRLNFINVFMIRENEFSDILTSESFLGSTALHYACLADNVNVIRILMQHNANPLIKNEMGHTSLNYIEDSADPNMQELLKNEYNTYYTDYQEILSRLKMEERRKFPLEDRIRQSIVGQELAIQNVAGAIRRKENGWVDTDHPLVFLFLGSSGIGKTELAKQVAQYLHGDKKSKNKKNNKIDNNSTYQGFIRIDMSEYQQKHEVSKFIGSPPGYIGHEEGGQLTKALTDCPNAVVLFDEIEKAHPDVLTIMLQLFDEGRLTDGKGTTIECKDAIFIMTSNLASDEIADYGIQLRRESEELQKAKTSGKILNENQTKELDKVVVSRFFKDRVVRPILKRHFKRDEFLGRINEIVYFLPFSRSELHRLVLKELQIWQERAQLKHKVSLSWESSIIGVLANGYDVHYGARSIKYEVERRVVNKLALAHENQLMLPGARVHIVISEDNEEYQLTKLKENVISEQLELPIKDSKDDDEDDDKTEENLNSQLKCKIKLLIENPLPSTENDSSFFRRFI